MQQQGERQRTIQNSRQGWLQTKLAVSQSDSIVFTHGRLVSDCRIIRTRYIGDWVLFDNKASATAQSSMRTVRRRYMVFAW